MSTLLQDFTPIEAFEPSPQDWEDHRAHLEAVESAERCDADARNLHRRRLAWQRAEGAVRSIEGIAADLSAKGRDDTARAILAACGNINAVLREQA